MHAFKPHRTLRMNPRRVVWDSYENFHTCMYKQYQISDIKFDSTKRQKKNTSCMDGCESTRNKKREKNNNDEKTFVTFRHGNERRNFNITSMVSRTIGGTPTKGERGRRTTTTTEDDEEERAKTRRGRRLFIWHAVVAVIGAFATTAGGGQHNKGGRR